MSSISGRLALCVSALLVALTFSACAAQTPPDADEVPTENGGSPSENGAGQTDGGEGTETPASDPAALTQEKCSQCHTYDRVEQAEKDREGWELTVDRMIRNGLQVSDQEKQTIIDYLAERDAG